MGDDQGVRQSFEFIQEEEGAPGQPGGKRRMALRHEQSFTVLGRKELESLGDVPTPYLLDELNIRGVLGGPTTLLQEKITEILEIIGGSPDAWYRLRNLVFLSAKEKWETVDGAAKMLDVQRVTAANAMLTDKNPYRKPKKQKVGLRLIETEAGPGGE